MLATSCENKATCHGQSVSQSPLTCSPRPVFRSRFCLQSQLGYIRDFSDPSLQVDDSFNVFTADPNEAQQYVDQEVAASKLRAIAEHFPDLTLTEVHYVARQGKWYATHG